MATVIAYRAEDPSMDASERLAKVEAQVESLKEDVVELKGDVKEIHSRITTGNREIIEKIESMEEKMEERMKKSAEAATRQHKEIELEVRKDVNVIADKVNVLERWRWMIVGGALVLGYMVSHIGLFNRFFGN